MMSRCHSNGHNAVEYKVVSHKFISVTFSKKFVVIFE